jgi:hypothetical protein
MDGPDMDFSQLTSEVHDTSNSGYNGDLKNITANAAVPGRIGQAVTLDGTNDFIDTTTHTALDNLGAFTYAAWVQPNNIVHNQFNAIVAKTETSGSASTQKRFLINSSGSCSVGSTIGCVELTIKRGTTDAKAFATADSVTNGQWYFVVGEWDGTNAPKIYVNGTEATYIGTPSAGSGTVNDDSAGDLLIGTWTGNGTTPGAMFGGLMDDVRVYDHALSQDEIQAIYKLGGSTKINTSLVMQPALNSGLVGHWTFDGKDIASTTSTRTAIDSSGNSNTGTMIGNAGTAIGKIGQGLGLDGVNDTVSVVNSSSIQSMASAGSINFWIKLNGTPDIDDMPIDVSNTGAGGLTVVFDIANDLVSLLYADSSDLVWATATTHMQNGQWYMVTCTWNSGGGVIYIDGVREGSDSTPPVLDFSGHTTYFGSNGGDSRFVNGTMDDIRFYNRVLSQEEITTLYKLGD